MDINANEDPNRIDYSNVPIDALRQSSCTILCRSLNPKKLFLSEEGYCRDWRGIAFLAGLCSLYDPFMSGEKDPMAKVLLLWRKEGDKQTANFENLVKFLGIIDRWDVADDLVESLAEDAKAFNSKKYQEKLTIARKEASVAYNEFNKDIGANFSPDCDILTCEDVQNAQAGLPPQMYDAFVLFADEDLEFATELISRLEEDTPKFGFKICVKDRDLVGGIQIEHEAIMRIISERCDRLILIISSAFLKSPANTFFINFAASVQIENRRRKIIPCIYEDCALPPSLNYYFKLKYYNTGKLFNFWEKLSDSIRSPPSIQVEEIKEPQKNITTISAPVKMPRKKTVKVPEPPLRKALSMKQLNSLEGDTTYRSECDLSSVGSSGSKKPKWWKIFPSKSAGSKTDLSVSASMSLESVEKSKQKKNWLKKRLTSTPA